MDPIGISRDNRGGVLANQETLKEKSNCELFNKSKKDMWFSAICIGIISDI